MSETTTIITALIPLVLGGIFSYFKPFLEDQREFKNRCAKMLAHSTENIAQTLMRLLENTLREIDFHNLPRGDGDKTRDLYDEVATTIAKHSKLNFRISVRLLIFRACYGVLLSGLLIGLLSFIASLILQKYNVLILSVCIVTAMIQVAAVVILYVLTRRSEDDEDIL